MYDLMPSEALEETPAYVVFKGAFSPAECDRVIAMANSHGTSEASTAGNVSDVRISDISWLYWQPSVGWVFDKLASAAYETHQRFLPCEVRAFPEALQITHYDGTRKGHYDWHKDVGAGPMKQRKLSFSVLLNDRADFDGGELELMSIPGDHVAQDAVRGTIVVFPSFEYHRVAPVTRGERWSLVAWASGPRWR